MNLPPIESSVDEDGAVSWHLTHDQRMLDHEINLINDAVDRFAGAMKAKMHKKALQGFRGWNDPNHALQFRAMLIEHATKDLETASQMIDTANFCLMVWLADLMKAEAARPEVACPHCHEDIADRMFENVENDEWKIVVIDEWKSLDTDNICPYCHKEYNLRCTYDQVNETVHDIVIEAR